ncbi:MAG: pyrroloquinoline quinone biosynthesis protein PqqB [Pararhizobium sp.]
MRAVVLGAAAGGGFPQWNCGCRNCVAVREGRPGFLPRSQSSIALSADGEGWAILNASPDIRAQINAIPVLHPTGPRTSPIRSVLITNGDLDHVAGLLTLREKQAFTLFLTREIAGIIDQNPVFQALDPAFVTRRVVQLDEDFELLPGISARLFAVPGKVPLYAEAGEVRVDLEGEQTVGVALSQSRGPAAFYIPGCARMTAALAERLTGAALVFFDGTLWDDDEMIAAGVGEKTGRRMGHMAMGGTKGTIAAFSPLAVARRIFVHINNTNPVLDPRSRERAEAERAGWEIGYDGMEVSW